MSGEHAFYVDVQVIPEHREAFDDVAQEEGCLEFR